jgi:hypothetical protein
LVTGWAAGCELGRLDQEQAGGSKAGESFDGEGFTAGVLRERESF